MLSSRLVEPDFPAEQGDHAHAPSVAGALRSAYLYLKRLQFQQARMCLDPVRLKPMSDGQRLRVLYIDALAARDSRRLALSTALFDHALRVALSLNARDDYGVLASELAKAHYFCQEFYPAAVAARLGLDAEQSSSRLRTVDCQFRLTELHHRLGVCLLHLEEFAAAEVHLFTAYHLADTLPALPAHAVKKAKICWDLAMLHYLSGNITLARYHAEQAVPLLDTFDSPQSCGRIQVLLAGLLLDHAAPHGESRPVPGRRHLLPHAASLLLSARLRFASSDDRVGLALASLVEARLSRLQNQRHDRRGEIESVVRLAQESGDLAFLGKAYTALGLEFLAMSEIQQGINCLRLAVGAFDDSQGPAEGLIARRLLYWAEEMREDTGRD